ncbi:hypothetical protein J7384_14800 [Endozoicomonas sp. G2_1]|uniref:hypothetical protein n=1 Tax=Endozoicomonas sp. G2_1 TaxID=2821091 RepID=UPI001ADD4E9F|nr:hypothetical protein [Endozoicomonas sp. G2_1]MBO9491634.1 hypothetical protein [Endozoicomonas sp. G2_1]
MTALEINSLYQRAQKTQQRRLVIRSIIALALFTAAVLNYFDSTLSHSVHLIIYVAIALFFCISYSTGHRTGAVKDLKKIADYYIQHDSRLAAINKNTEV